VLASDASKQAANLQCKNFLTVIPEVADRNRIEITFKILWLL